MEAFESVLRQNDRGGCVVELPFDAKAIFGTARAPVVATVNDHVFRTRLMRYGGTDYLGLNRTVRDGAAVEPGDTVSLSLELDKEPRTVDPPPELASALATAPAAREAFSNLSFTHRREYAEWIGGAKRADTRRRRAARAVEMLTNGVRQP